MSVMQVLSKAVEQDPDAGSMLIDQVVYDFMCDLVEENRPALEQLHGMWALDRVQVAKRALARGYVESVSKGAYPGEDVQQAAEWLAAIERFVVAAAQPSDVSKSMSEWWDVNGKQVQRQVSRDANGRFTRGVNQNASRPINPTDTGRMSPALKPFANGTEWTGGLKPETAAAHQGKYEEAVNIAQELGAALGDNKNSADVSLMVQNPGGDIRQERVTMKDIKALEQGGFQKLRNLSPADSILAVEVVPKMGASAAEAAKIAEFNLLGGAGGAQLAQLANVDAGLRQALADSLKMPDAAEDKSNLSRLFGVLSAGGSVLSSVPGFEKTGQMAALVGEMGPQAEEVLGPYVKRSAYRYRGTEKTPDQELRDPQATLTKDQFDRIKAEFAGASPEQMVMFARGDAASAILEDTIPEDPIIARLSEKSGQVLPSQGVMYDRDGKLVSQSVGFTDDHYLPFDLNNLSRLRGGQYVRTRQQGGLTGEDVYTAIMSGARQVQVVSNSGVFTLEMAPDFRGGRAMSDKARSMYTNYLKVLDAVENSGLYLEDISSKEKQQKYDDARKLLGNDADPSEIRDLAERNIEIARQDAQSITGDDEIEAARMALDSLGIPAGADPLNQARNLRSLDRRRFEDAYNENLDAKRAQKANRLRLNGQGYEVALETLQQQFPYFIETVKYRPLDALPRGNNEKPLKTRAFAQDAGYAQPGSLRARGVRTGYYNPGPIKPGAKPQKNRPTPAANTASTEEKPAETVARESSEGATTEQQVSKPKKKAPDVGMQRELNLDANIPDQLNQQGTALYSGLRDVPMAQRSLTGLMDTSFRDVAGNKTEAARWFFAQTDPDVIRDTLKGPDAVKAAEALSDPDAVSSAIRSVIDGGEEFFEDGNTIGGQKSLEGAVNWAVATGRRAGDLVAMQEGFAEEAKTLDGVINYRGLMPMQMQQLQSVTDLASFDAVVDENPDLAEAARSIATDGKGLRSLAEMSTVAGERLDALQQLKSGQQEMRSKINQGMSPEQAVKSVPQSAWTKATGEGSLGTPQDVITLDVDAKAKQLQEAWSLAAMGRVMSALDGGDAWDPKEGNRLMPVAKALRTPLMSLAGTPIL